MAKMWLYVTQRLYSNLCQASYYLETASHLIWFEARTIFINPMQNSGSRLIHKRLKVGQLGIQRHTEWNLISLFTYLVHPVFLHTKFTSIPIRASTFLLQLFFLCWCVICLYFISQLFETRRRCGTQTTDHCINNTDRAGSLMLHWEMHPSKSYM